MAVKLWENVHLSFGYNYMKFDFTEEKCFFMILTFN